MQSDLVVLFEHPEWQQPLFRALEARGVDFAPFDLKAASFDPDSLPEARLYFNQASPSAYNRGSERAVPLALSLMRCLELRGARVLNGSRAFSLELSKSAQAALCRSLGVPHPRCLAFNDGEAAIAAWSDWPCLLKPEQGGSGARMFQLDSPDDLRRLLDQQPELWRPDNLLLLQQLFPVDPEFGVVRMEFMGGELLYAMRIVSHGAFNLCPSEVCNPLEGPGSCGPDQPVEFFPYPEVPESAVRQGLALMEAGGLDIGGIEYLLGPGGEPVFYDINANSNLRPPVAAAFGFDPFVRVAAWLESQL